MIKQLSYASPTMKRHTQNDQKELVKAVARPPVKPAMLAPEIEILLLNNKNILSSNNKLVS